jgi:hypothetical protein
MAFAKSEMKIDQDLDLMWPEEVTSQDSFNPAWALWHTKLAAAASLRGLENPGFYFHLDKPYTQHTLPSTSDILGELV